MVAQCTVRDNINYIMCPWSVFHTKINNCKSVPHTQLVGTNGKSGVWRMLSDRLGYETQPLMEHVEKHKESIYSRVCN